MPEISGDATITLRFGDGSSSNATIGEGSLKRERKGDREKRIRSFYSMYERKIFSPLHRGRLIFSVVTCALDSFVKNCLSITQLSPEDNSFFATPTSSPAKVERSL